MKRYRVKYTVYDNGFEEDAYEESFDTIEEATLNSIMNTYDDENGDSCTAEIIDRNILGVVRNESKYGKPGIVYVDGSE